MSRAGNDCFGKRYFSKQLRTVRIYMLFYFTACALQVPATNIVFGKLIFCISKKTKNTKSSIQNEKDLYGAK